jgi:hypothetical protein
MLLFQPKSYKFHYPINLHIYALVSAHVIQIPLPNKLAYLCSCSSPNRTNSAMQSETMHQVMTIIDMRPVTGTRSRGSIVSNCRTDGHKSSRISPTGGMATAPKSDTRAKLIIPPEARTTTPLTMEHRPPVTQGVPVMQHTGGPARFMELIPTGTMPAALHRLPTHLLDTANNSPLQNTRHS